jgi:hypothetical protein
MLDGFARPRNDCMRMRDLDGGWDGMPASPSDDEGLLAA